MLQAGQAAVHGRGRGSARPGIGLRDWGVGIAHAHVNVVLHAGQAVVCGRGCGGARPGIGLRDQGLGIAHAHATGGRAARRASGCPWTWLRRRLAAGRRSGARGCGPQRSRRTPCNGAAAHQRAAPAGLRAPMRTCGARTQPLLAACCALLGCVLSDASLRQRVGTMQELDCWQQGGWAACNAGKRQCSSFSGKGIYSHAAWLCQASSG